MLGQGKTINLHLYSGNPNDVICVEDSSWTNGKLYTASHKSVKELLKTDVWYKNGIYLLIFQEKVFVGEISNLSKQLSQHNKDAIWWERIVVLTTKDDSLNHTDIAYLESVLSGKHVVILLDADAKQFYAQNGLSNSRRARLDRYLGGALFLMELIGIPSLSSNARQSDSLGIALTNGNSIRPPAGSSLKKSAAMQYVRDHGINLDKNTTVAKLQESSGNFWANPQRKLLECDWHMILNNNVKYELIVLSIPANTLSIKEEDDGQGLVCRRDKPELIDLQINCRTLVDQRSGVSFAPYVVARLPY